MKNKAYLFAALACVLACGKTYGQTGLLFSQTDITHTDILRLSHGDTQFGTARSAAMGGAFTSLGADLSSMHINPAGLGMYQSSEFAITPMMTWTKISSTNDGYISNGKNGKNRFSLANFGGAFNFYEGSGLLTSFTFGVGYNRIADHNYNNYMDIGQNGTTIARIFANQLEGINPGNIDDLHPNTIDRCRWGALLAYHNYLIDSDENNPTHYGAWEIGPGTRVGHAAAIKSRGYTDEYNISGGFNFRNTLYLGFSIGIRDFSMKQTVLYDEDYENNDSQSIYSLSRYLQYDQYTKISGSGVNFKFGVTYRPVDALRIGLAVHTPTYGTVTHRYDTFMYYEMDNGEWEEAGLFPSDWELKFSTPTKLLGGISYTFGSLGVVSLDYERTWYDKMRNRSNYSDHRGMNGVISKEFKANNTFRFGLEVRPTDLLSVRLGGTYTDSMLAIDTKEFVYDSPMPEKTYNITGGIGYRLGRFATLDLAYIYSQTKYSAYHLYYDKNEGYAGELSQKMTRGSVLTTLRIRF